MEKMRKLLTFLLQTHYHVIGKKESFSIDFVLLIYREFIGGIMINFEEELKKFKPSLEIEEAEDAICRENTVDVTDILSELMKNQSK